MDNAVYKRYSPNSFSMRLRRYIHCFITCLVLAVAAIGGLLPSADAGVYVLDHWEVLVAEEWNWGQGGFKILQQWDNIGPGVRSFSWSGESETGRSAEGNMSVVVPDVIDDPSGWSVENISALGQARVTVRSSESGFLKVGLQCWDRTYNGYGSCSYEGQEMLPNPGSGSVSLIARQEGSAGGPGFTPPPRITFAATAGARGLWGGFIQDIQQWSVRAIAVYRTLSSPEPDSNVEVGHEWTSEPLSGDYQTPVVILGPPTYHDPDPGVARLKNVQPDNIQIRFQEWDYLDGNHADELIPYLVFEKGQSALGADGRLAVDTFDIGGTGNWQAVSFQQAFVGTPFLFLTVQTNNGTSAVTVRARNITATGFQAALFEEEAFMNGHEIETVGYLAVYSPQPWGVLDINGVQTPYLLQQFNVDQRFIPVLSSHLKLEEERSKDNETAHADETVHVLVVKDNLFAQIVSANSSDTTELRRHAPEYSGNLEWGLVHGVDHNWLQVPLAKAYSHPVVFAKPVSAHDLQPGVIRMREAANDRFQLRYQEWEYLDGVHAPEDVFYLVSEMGTQAAAGHSLEAWKIDSSVMTSSESWEHINLSNAFSQVPALFSAVQTCNDESAVTTRIKNAAPNAFELAMTEQESGTGGHDTETIGWIAVSRGIGTTSDSRALLVDSGPGFQSTQVTLPIIFDRRYPVMIADVNSTNESDPIFIRFRDPTSSGMLLYLNEELSADSESDHADEIVAIFTAGHLRNNQWPVANAGVDQKTAPGKKIILDGSVSWDPDGDITAYRWTQTAGTAVNLNMADTSKADFTAPSATTSLKFELTVIDNDSNSSADLVVVEVCRPKSQPWIPYLLNDEQ